jgi:spermidine synthase
LEAFSPAVRVITQPWQLARLPTQAYDVVMHDTWPPDGYADADFAQFVERVAIPCLRPGGRFSFFHSGAMLGEARRNVLDQYFPRWTAYPYTMPEEQVPRHWTKPGREFLIPIAIKGDHG